MGIFDKRPDENRQQYLWRIGNMKDAGLIEGSWGDIADNINEQLGAHRGHDSYRREYGYAKQYKERVFDREYSKLKSKDSLRSEVLKVQANTKNLETNKWIRELARDELILEEIKKSIKDLSPLPVPDSIPDSGDHSKVGILCFGDEHFGTEFTINDIDGGVINAYSPEIFYRRMWTLQLRALKIIKDNNLSEIRVYEMGDFADGILRTSQLMKLRYGVIESTVKYASFLCGWLNELTKHVRVVFQMTEGNHTELRMIGAPKGTFKDDNLTVIVREFVKLQLGNNPNFKMITNTTGYIVDDVCGYNVLGIHGECNNPEQTLKDMSVIYKRPINYLLTGHTHHRHNTEAGVDTEVIGIPSVIGVDTYSMSINKTSKPGATFLLFEDSVGKTVEYSISLNQT